MQYKTFIIKLQYYLSHSVLMQTYMRLALTILVSFIFCACHKSQDSQPVNPAVIKQVAAPVYYVKQLPALEAYTDTFYGKYIVTGSENFYDFELDGWVFVTYFSPDSLEISSKDKYEGNQFIHFINGMSFKKSYPPIYKIPDLGGITGGYIILTGDSIKYNAQVYENCVNEYSTYFYGKRINARHTQ